MPPTPEMEAEQKERQWVELALMGVDAVRYGIVRGFTLDAIEGSDEEDIVIKPDNTVIVRDIIELRYGDKFPDLFGGQDEKA